MPTIDAPTLLAANPCLTCLSERDRALLRVGYWYQFADNLGLSPSATSVSQAFVGLSLEELHTLQSAMLQELAIVSGETFGTPQTIFAENPCLQCLSEEQAEWLLISEMKDQLAAAGGGPFTDAEMLSELSALQGASIGDIEAIGTGLLCQIVNLNTGSSCDSPNAWMTSQWLCCAIGSNQFALQAALLSGFDVLLPAEPGNLTDEAGNELTDDAGNQIGLNP